MRIPLSWIKEYIHIQLSPDEIAKILTMAGLEVDGYETLTFPFQGIVVGEVMEVQKHPNADKLTIATVTDGKDSYQVVCGAPNCRQGLKTAFAPIGAILKEADGQEFKIQKTKIRGTESFGMLCSGKELGLSEDHDGILELPASTPLGVEIEKIYTDTIFDISLTPNLGHCSSVLGVARELAAATGLPLHEPLFTIQETDNPIEEHVQLTVLAPQSCPRYTCRLIRGIKVGPSPDWLRLRLERCGLRSINNIVDATNYVLLEIGHPLHAFDYNQLQGQQIIVKNAAEGERFTTLDNKERLLTSQDLMICDAQRSIAIAGIMGGMNTEVQEATTDVLLEAAYFNPVSIRRTSKHLGLYTDASKRFERGTDPNGLIYALDRAAALIQIIAGGNICAGILDVSTQKFPEKMVTCRLNRINQLLGIIISQGEIDAIFQRLRFHSHWEGQETLIVQVPTYRVDIQSEVDLIEEIARLYGYDNIPKGRSHYQTSQQPHAFLYPFEKEMRSHLMGEGLQEFLTCDLIGPSSLDVIQTPTHSKETMIHVLNPTSVEQSILRTSLLPGLLQVMKYNIDHQNRDIGGFEIGRVHFQEGTQFKEPSVVAIILTGQSQPHFWEEKARPYDFFDLKGIVENLLEEFGVLQPVFKNLSIPTFHDGRQASVFVDALELGSFGELHPAILRRLDVTQRILFGEFNLPDLIQVGQLKDKVHPLAIYPSSTRDWTVTVQAQVPFAQILKAIKDSAPLLLEKVSLIGIYRSEKIGADFQNMTLNFVYRDLSKTISQEEVEREHQKLMIEVLKKLGDTVKSKAN